MVMFNEFDNSQKKIVYKDEKDDTMNTMTEALSAFRDSMIDEEEDNTVEEQQVLELDNDNNNEKEDNVEKTNTPMLSLEDILMGYSHGNDSIDDEDDVDFDTDFDILDDDGDLWDDEDRVEKEPEYIYIPKSKKELNSFERLMLKTYPHKYRLGVDPRLRFKLEEERRNAKRKKKLEKTKNMTPEEIEAYYEKKKRKKEIKAINKFMKQAKQGLDPKNRKKRKKTEEKIKKAYYRQLKSQRQQFKTIDDIIYNQRLEEYKNQIGYNYFYGNTRRKIDPYARYRKHGNIITVSEAENFEKDFKTSFMKNLEMELMNKINEPVTLGGKTVVEYYDSKGRLKERELLDDKMSKKKKKKLKKQEKKLKNKMISPNYHKLY